MRPALIAALLLGASSVSAAPRPPVVLDTDANNELDDQHAIAYLLLGGHRVEGITVNRTPEGGRLADHVEEARRVVRLCAAEHVPIYAGADGGFADIAPHTTKDTYDGKAAVDFIVARARARSPADPLVVVAIGKLTNVALALHTAPDVARTMRVLWLGSNWPRDAGEYNEVADHAAVNHVLDSEVPLEIALVRHGVRGPTAGTDAVRVRLTEMKRRMPGRGPPAPAPVPGRHGGTFTRFGDYSVDLFVHMGDATRALYDVAAVALVAHPTWARSRDVPAPRIVGGGWQARPTNPRRVRVYEGFDRNAIVADFFRTMGHRVARAASD